MRWLYEDTFTAIANIRIGLELNAIKHAVVGEWVEHDAGKDAPQQRPTYHTQDTINPTPSAEEGMCETKTGSSIFRIRLIRCEHNLLLLHTKLSYYYQCVNAMR